MKYAKLFNKLRTPQWQPIPGSTQVPNTAGGYAWEVDRWAMFDRFLILGSEEGTYYIDAQKLTVEHAKNAMEAIREDGVRAVVRIVEISGTGRAPKNDPAIFALALAAAYGNDETRALAYESVPRICRTGTHLFAFAEACQALRGWGRGLRKAVGRWYNEKSAEALAYQVVKYQSRNGWSNRDLLRLSHPKPATDDHKVLYKWIVDDELTGNAKLVEATLALKSASVDQAVAIVREFKVPREALPTELLNEAKIWEALLEDMPLTAMIRNLGNLSKCGLLKVGSEAAAKVVAELTNDERLRKARVHPIALLNALNTYARGAGFKGSGKWTPVPAVVDALDAAFYRSFANVEPSGKRIVVGLDVSGSMAGTAVSGLAGMECRQAAGAMALVSAATEANVSFVAFDTSAYSLALSARQRLDDVVNVLARTGGGGTDCSIPMRYALDKKIEADAIVIYTDSETWQGSEHPAQSLAKLRNAYGPVKLVVVAMAGNRYTVGEAGDPLTLNVVGFDASAPQAIAEFLR